MIEGMHLTGAHMYIMAIHFLQLMMLHDDVYMYFFVVNAYIVGKYMFMRAKKKLIEQKNKA